MIRDRINNANKEVAFYSGNDQFAEKKICRIENKTGWIAL
jgi:hypothetical protein